MKGQAFDKLESDESVYPGAVVGGDRFISLVAPSLEEGRLLRAARLAAARVL